MAHTFLLFDFASNEEAAQQARHRIEGWKQGFRLGKKIEVKFERSALVEATAGEPDGKAAATSKGSKASGKSKAKAGGKAKSAKGDKEGADEAEAASGSTNIRLIVRLDFSDHEKLSHQRWVERIPTEEPFKDANPKILRINDAEFRTTSDLFDSLD